MSGQGETIKAKWLLGGRKVAYRMSCRPIEQDHTVHFHEVVVERNWGIPPPTLTMETTSASGWKRSGAHKDVSAGGRGTLDYAKVRNTVEIASIAAGWNFKLEGDYRP